VHHISKRVVLAGIGGIVVGALAILAVRFFAYNPEQIHYHANFAVYLNGQRETFTSPMYYEEVSGSCTVGKDIKPAQRAHMHDKVNNAVHVHDHGVTWGDFFMNLGWAVGPDFIRTPDAIYLPNKDADEKITYVINGQSYDTIATELIKSEDRLLINFGNTAQHTLDERFATIASTAHRLNTTKDPAACLGNNAPTWKDRLRHLFN
jgi:hypothetical protein